MRIGKRWFCSVLLAVGSIGILSAGPMTEAERNRLLSHLQMTATWLPDEVAGLSPAQLNFRPAPDKWTIAEAVEHLVIVEPTYWKLLQDGLSRPPQELPKKPSDADVLWYGIDRTHRDKTPAKQDPRGQKIDLTAALAAYRRMHATLLDYAAKTTDDLRAHTVPEWGVDAYQCLLEISTHEQRHILQIREIKADPAFPKK